MAAKKSPDARGKGYGGGSRQGQKNVRSASRPASARFAKKKAFISTDNLKKRQTAVLETVSNTVNSFSFTTKIVASLIVMTLAVAALVSLTKSQLTINEKQKRLDELDTQIAQQMLDNEELETKIKDRNQYVEAYAREKLDMVKPGERVYINTVGD